MYQIAPLLERVERSEAAPAVSAHARQVEVALRRSCEMAEVASEASAHGGVQDSGLVAQFLG